jgi:hypothetical protein
MTPVDDRIDDDTESDGTGSVLASAEATASRHRSHRRPGRHRAILARYDDDEFCEIASAAARAGLTPTGFVASVALAVARVTSARSAAGAAPPPAAPPPAAPQSG